MLKIYKTTAVEKKIKKAKRISVDCWIDMVSPTSEEIDRVIKVTEIDKDLILKMLDEEETPRIEEDDNAILVVVDTPYLEEDDGHFTYNTRPLGIIITNNNYVITVSPSGTNVLNDFKKNRVKNFRTAKKTRFLIQILLYTSSSYQRALKIVNRKIEIKEETLVKSTSNKDLIDMLDLEKTLVYFITSLKANDLVLKKLSKGIVLPLYDEDEDLLQDAIIENKQAIEQSEIYRNILGSITDTYATIVSNNLNQVMKFLAGATIILSIPTMIYSFMGMNVKLGALATHPYAALGIFLGSLVIAIIAVIWLLRRNML
ncbi:MAG: magnesium transporter CorA family protein [Bacilli bacterium]|nr:magnesium transporter CorA family protein [Bacilli bacterium]